MRSRYRAVVEYDGTSYHGFQIQRDQPTVQGEIERAIQAVSGQENRVIGAGRTDSGVHALGQVIAFEVDWRHGPEALLRAMNANMPEDIAVKSLSVAHDEFHPRFWAKRRAYAYHIYNGRIRSPLRRWHSWHVRRPLDLERMNQAATCLVGVLDFATFGQPPEGVNTVRQVFFAEWRRTRNLLVFEIEANAFLYRMVRSLVGSMKTVGEGVWTVDAFRAALAAKDRSRAQQTAPPQGLFLTTVSYA